jgi:hypothetical protein
MSVMHCLINNRYPLLIDDSQYDVIKYKCNECVSIYKFCTNEVLIPVSEINNSDKLEYLTKIITSDISQWHINRDNISESDLKLLSYLIAILYNIEEKLLDKLKSVVLLDDFLKDIKDNPNNDFINIAFSLFRSVAFPSISASNRHQLSIDCHLNNPSKLSGYDLYRVDVMPPNRSGNASSGCERLLFTIKNNKYYFIYYTSTHDFVTKTIQQRLSNILES